jgi:hypothetical protein
VREGVRSGIAAAIEHDVELRGGRTARLLVAAGAIGVAGAVGVTLFISGHPFDHHPPWHVTVFASVWTGMLVVTLAVAFLEIRTPRLPLARSASVAILGLGLAGVCGAACPDQHFLDWWVTTGVGARATQSGGHGLSALCFGLATTFLVALVSAFVRLGNTPTPVGSLLPAALLLFLLLPGIALQSVGQPTVALAGWLAGAAGGAYLGVHSGMLLRALLPFRS